MQLFNLNLVPPSSITAAVIGNFSPLTRQQQILVVRGSSRLELLQVDSATGKATSLLVTDAFGTVRSVAPFRLTGGTKDYIILGSDSGRIVVLEYDPANNSLVKLQEETFGKSGIRRHVPGQYLAVDPKGRACMIGALEKSKLVYVLNRDAAANLTISSPLEAHKPNAIIHHMVGVDVGFENPLFAALEVDFSESDQDPTGQAFEEAAKMLTYYELDLGLNHVVRRWSEPTDPRANLLVQLPGGQSSNSDQYDGPSGVLVCAENYIIYKHQGVPEHRVPIPRRETPLSDPNRGIIIVASVLHKMKGDFFVLAQSEEGDIFKITVDRNGEDVEALKIKYFDTIPVANSLCILKSGFLFAASDFSNHHVYQFDKLGEDGGEVSSADYPEFGTASEPPPAYFKARPLENLIQVDELDSFAPIIDAKIANVMHSDSPQIFTACGRGANSSLKMMRHGLEVEELVSSNLGFAPTGIWSTKLGVQDAYDSYIVLSSHSATYVLSIGESIEQVANSGLIEDQRTLGIQQMGSDSIVQVHTSGFLRIRNDGGVVKKEPWPDANSRVHIVACAMNSRQMMLATSTHELIYFEVDQEEEMNEFTERKALGVPITCLSMADVPEGRQRTPYVAIGCEDKTLRIVSLALDTCLDTISIQALTANSSSLCMAEILDASIDRVRPTLFVNIGLSNGVLLRTVLDGTTGQLTDTRTRFLGPKTVELRRAVVQGQPSVLALSTRTWLNYVHQGLLQFDPLIFEMLDQACGLAAEVCPEGIMGITGETLRIFTLPKLGSKVKTESLSLTYTPRDLIFHPKQHILYTIESDHRTLSPSEQESRLKAVPNPDDYKLDTRQFGLPRAPAGSWASCIRAVDVRMQENATLSQIHLDNNEAAFSIALVPFAAREHALHLVVGTAKDTLLIPRSCSKGYLRTYLIKNDGAELEFLHSTEVDDIPMSLMAFQGRLMAGVGKALRIYEIGMKRLLRKVENKSFSAGITTMSTQGSRIIVGDQQDSLFYCTYKAPENRLLVFADDTQPRFITSHVMMDYDTVAGADKFGNIFINRIDEGVSETVDADPTGASILHEKGFLMGAPHKTQMLAHYHVGDICSSLHKVALVPGGREVLLYTGYSGVVGLLIPFASREDVAFFQELEMHMRQESKSLVGRNHLDYRGYYAPVKSVVDGNLCETFAHLPMQKQAQIAQELDRTALEVLKKLEQIRQVSSFG